MFKKLEEDEALIVERGVYKMAEVYEGPDGGLFVKAKGGFVRVRGNGSTSHETVRLETLHREGELYQDQFGRLCTNAGQGRRRTFIEMRGSDMKLLVEDANGKVKR